jgi:hypothetical protein
MVMTKRNEAKRNGGLGSLTEMAQLRVALLEAQRKKTETLDD